MQLYLSNLVDLALGKPHLMECEQYNLLHALLHVMLKKLNMADSRIELLDQLAGKAEKIINTLPKDSSLCFREYALMPGGGKIRKKAAALCPKKSLLQINRKWPQCCHSAATSTASSSTNSCNSFTKTVKEAEDQKIFGELTQRLSILEADQKSQNQFNRAAMQEFQKLKDCCEELTKDLKKTSLLQIENQKCKSRSVQRIQGSENSETSEINWLKQRLLEMSESLKLHSECLRKIKCEDLPKIKSTQEELFNSMHAIKFQLVKHFEAAKSEKLNESKCEIEGLKNQVIHVSSRICEVEKSLETCRQSTSVEMLTLRNATDKIREQMSTTSEIVKIGNLEYSDESKRPATGNSSKHLEVRDEKLQESFSCICPKVTSSIFDIKKQVSSQSICMQQLVRDLAMKLDKCEFQSYCHNLNDTIQSLMQLKNDFCLPAAAGGSIPLLRKVNCISCKAAANMKITASSLPKMQPMKGYPDCVNHCNQSISEANWSCYSQKSGPRRIGVVSRYGSSINRMKYRRQKTPFKSCGSPLSIYKNHFRNNSYC